MKVSVQENTVKPGSYRLVLHTGRLISFEDFIRHAEGGELDPDFRAEGATGSCPAGGGGLVARARNP